MVTPLSNTIQRLQEILKDENCRRMNHSSIKGYLGELLVKQKLEGEGIEVTHKGNQSGYDLQVEGVKIDVKCSTPKEFGVGNNH